MGTRGTACAHLSAKKCRLASHALIRSTCAHELLSSESAAWHGHVALWASSYWACVSVYKMVIVRVLREEKDRWENSGRAGGLRWFAALCCASDQNGNGIDVAVVSAN